MQKLSKNSLLVSIFIVLLAAAWTAYTAYAGVETTGGRIPAPRKGFLAPDIPLTTLDGQSARLNDLRGNAVILNFWASWCPPCRAEMPALQQVHVQFHGKGLIVLGVNATSQDALDAAVQFMQENNLSMPVSFDFDGIAMEKYQVRALPTTFFIDAEGVIQDVSVGGPMSEAFLTAQALRLTGEKP